MCLKGNRQAGRRMGYSNAVSRCLIWHLPADTGSWIRNPVLAPEVVRARLASAGVVYAPVSGRFITLSHLGIGLAAWHCDLFKLL